MKAIVTQYKGPTNTRGSRIVASAEGVGFIVSPYDDRLDSDGNHEAAARKLCSRQKWKGKLATGMLPDGISRVHVFVREGSTFEVE